MTRESLIREIQVVMSKIGPQEFTNQELEMLLPVMRQACDRETALPDNVIQFNPRSGCRRR